MTATNKPMRNTVALSGHGACFQTGPGWSSPLRSGEPLGAWRKGRQYFSKSSGIVLSPKKSLWRPLWRTACATVERSLKPQRPDGPEFGMM